MASEKMDSVAEDETPVKNPSQPTVPPSPGIKALLNFSQYLADGDDALQKDMSQTDSMEIRQYGTQLSRILRSLAGECVSKAEEVKMNLDAAAEGRTVKKALPDEGESASDLTLDGEGEGESKSFRAFGPPRRDHRGFVICKSFPDWRPRRFTRSDLKEIVVTLDNAEEVDPTEAKAVMDRLAKAKKQADYLLKIPKK